jgi:hypothetical protein
MKLPVFSVDCRSRMMRHGREYIVTEMDGLPCWKNHENMLLAWPDSSIQKTLVPAHCVYGLHVMTNLLAEWLNLMTYRVSLTIHSINKCPVLI